MPYISRDRRKALDEELDILGENIESVGELDYAFTRLAGLLVKKIGGRSYTIFNSVIGVFESAKLEFYRRRLAPYEDKKIQENGDVD